MTDRLEIRGLALPYNTATMVRGVCETVSPWAIRADRRPATLLWGDHIGADLCGTADGSLRVFSSRDGLFFSASFDWSHPSAIWIARTLRSESWGVSVQFAHGWEAVEWEENGERQRDIRKAEIEHVSIVRDPAYASTAAWPADLPIDETPPDLARVMSRWEIGDRIFNQDRRRGVVGHVPAAGDRARGRGNPAPLPKGKAPDSLVALMNSPRWRAGVAASHAAWRSMAKPQTEGATP